MTDPTYYTRPEIIRATIPEWFDRTGAPKYGASAPIVRAYAGALSGLTRTGLRIDRADYPTPAMASNRIRRMIDHAYPGDMVDDAGNEFGQIDPTDHPACHLVTVDEFAGFAANAPKVIGSDTFRPKVTQTARRIIARLPERGWVAGVAVTVVDGMMKVDTTPTGKVRRDENGDAIIVPAYGPGVVFTAYRLV